MAASSSSSHQIPDPDITTCSICLETFKEPKLLPCIHTFCLHCLDSYCEGKKNEQELSCPQCRKAFLIPPGGIENLPDNFFIHQLLNVNKSFGGNNFESVGQRPCELCSGSDAEISSTYYCVECDQHMCDRCSMTHTKAKVSKSHRMVLHSNLPSPQKRIKLAVNYCEQHPCEQNRLYCNDCKTIMCLKCLSKHSQHKLSDIDEAGETFRDQLSEDIKKLGKCVNKQQTNLKQFKVDMEHFLAKLAFTEHEISQKCDKLISLIQSHKKELFEQMCQFKDNILKEAETKKDDMEKQLLITENFKKYCAEMTSKGTACDISHDVHNLRARAEELMRTRDGPDDHKLKGAEIIFKRSLSTLSATDSVKNLIGGLILGGKVVTMKDDQIVTMKDDQIVENINLTTFLTNHTVVQGIHCRQSIVGLTVMGNEVYVVRCTSSVVYVYKSDDFTFVRNVMINGARKLLQIDSCSHHNCLYAVSSADKIIYRYDLGTKVTTNWPVFGECYGLSVSKCHNLLVTLYCARRIREYSTLGALISDISLDSSIDDVLHCVQLSTGNNYVVCHEGVKQHRVCIVDQGGHIVHSYGGSVGSGVGQLNCPIHLAVDKDGNVLVADIGNDRVQLFSPTLSLLGDVVLARYQLEGPIALKYDELKHRLYIAERRGGRFFALQLT